MVQTRSKSKPAVEDVPAAAAKPKRTRAAGATSTAKGRPAAMEEPKAKTEDAKPARKKVQIAEPVKPARLTKTTSKTADEAPPKTMAKAQPKTRVTRERKPAPKEEPKSIMKKPKARTVVKVEQTASTTTRSTRAVRSKRNPAIASKAEPKAAPALRHRRAIDTTTDDKSGPSIPAAANPPSLQTSAEALIHSISLSPTKPLGSPIRLPPRPKALQESPIRCSPLRLGPTSAHKPRPLPPPAFGLAPEPSATGIRASPLRPAGGGSVHKPRPTPLGAPAFALAGELPLTAFRTSALSPFKSLGTPVRRPLGASGALFGGGAAGAMTALRPWKRALDESPRRPMSAYADKRARVEVITPVRRPRSAEEPRAGLSSCLRGGREGDGGRKTVAFAEEPTAEVEESFVAEPMAVDRRSLSTVMEVSTQSDSPALAVAEAGVEVQPVLLLDEPVKAPAVLGGATFYLDVWGSDGSCANQYFEPLLEELGAKVAKEWSEEVTHVLYKDGDGMTLKKAAQSRSGVRCVNVGWAVDCERFQAFLPEDDYEVKLDTESAPPRTPLRSMDSNSLLAIPMAIPGTVRFKAQIEALEKSPAVKTPMSVDVVRHMDVDDSEISPQSSPLVQKSCPPKQLSQVPFAEDDGARRKLFKAARKSLGDALRIKWDDNE